MMSNDPSFPGDIPDDGYIFVGNQVVFTDDLFNGQAWRGSECVFSSPISMHNTTVGFVLCLVSHFNEVTDKEITILKSIGDFVSHGLENLETMEKYILGDKSKNRILQIN